MDYNTKIITHGLQYKDIDGRAPLLQQNLIN